MCLLMINKPKFGKIEFFQTAYNLDHKQTYKKVADRKLIHSNKAQSMRQPENTKNNKNKI